MSFSWRGIFHKHDHSGSNHHSGHASTSSSGVNGRPSHSAINSGANSSANGASAGSAASASLNVPPSTASDPSASGSTSHTNGHAIQGSGLAVPTTVQGDGAGPTGGMVSRLRVWEDLERPDMPLLGFENFGNTCYANSVLQALYHCQPFRESILKHMDENPSPRTAPAPASLTTPQNKTPASAEAAQQGSIPHALQDLFAQMTEQSIATAQAAHAAAVSHHNALSTSTGSGFSAKRAFGGLSMGGLGGIPPVSAAPVPNMGVGFSMGASAGGTASAGQPGGNGSGTGTAAAGKDGGTKRAVNQAAIKAFLAALRKENVMFDSTMHQDAHEMLNFVLNRVGEELVDGDNSKGDAQSVVNASPAIGSSTSGSSVSKADHSKGNATRGDDTEGKTARTPSPGDAVVAAAGLQDTTGTSSNYGTPSRMGALAMLGHRRSSRQATLPIGLEAQLGLGAEGKGNAGPDGSVVPKSSRRSLVGRFGFGKSNQH
ncbi:hypothetical protein A4X13_0g1486 [Tilletia indica]|uniref:ubiquitinyl hydrolase 1 n=1 Tax=Tilletia indica TaxID=43049 RepID=A0A8T8TBL0_9BASI|nr:hypothetical protein A4X13_0g1486 [Tilletia indica]